MPWFAGYSTLALVEESLVGISHHTALTPAEPSGASQSSTQLNSTVQAGATHWLELTYEIKPISHSGFRHVLLREYLGNLERKILSYLIKGIYLKLQNFRAGEDVNRRLNLLGLELLEYTQMYLICCMSADFPLDPVSILLHPALCPGRLTCGLALGFLLESVSWRHQQETWQSDWNEIRVFLPLNCFLWGQCGLSGSPYRYIFCHPSSQFSLLRSGSSPLPLRPRDREGSTAAASPRCHSSSYFPIPWPLLWKESLYHKLFSYYTIWVCHYLFSAGTLSDISVK